MSSPLILTKYRAREDRAQNFSYMRELCAGYSYIVPLLLVAMLILLLVSALICHPVASAGLVLINGLVYSFIFKQLRRLRRDTNIPHVAVYCGSARGSNPDYIEMANEVGQRLAQDHVTTVYGGANTGLMGAVADGALSMKGTVVGILTSALNKPELEIAHTGLTRLEIVDSMHQRQERMIELSDGFIVLPGGYGTLAEMLEVVTWLQLGTLRNRNLVLLDPVPAEGKSSYWEPFLQFVNNSVEQGFIKPEHQLLIRHTHFASEAIRLALGPAQPYVAKNATRSASK